MSSCAERQTTVAAEFSEVCGQDGPVLVLAREGPLAHFRYMGQFGERRVLRLAERDSGDFLGGPASKDPEFWSIGPCGEAPMQLDLGPGDTVRGSERWPELLLSCDESGQVRAVDPAGAHPQNFVFEAPNCNWSVTPEGLVNILPLDPLAAPGLGSLVLQAWPDDPWTESAPLTVLLESVNSNSLQLADEQAFVRTPDGDVLSVDWVGGQAQLVVQQARSFLASDNGRYVLWQDLEITNDDPESPEGPLFILDRETGETHYLRDGAVRQLFMSSRGDSGAGFVWLRAEPNEVNEYVRLPSFEAVTLPGGEFPDDSEHCQTGWTRTVVDNERQWQDKNGTIVLHDLAAASQRLLFEGGTAFRFPGHDAINAINAIEHGCDDDEGPLWRVGLTSDDELELLAERASPSHAWLDDGRVVTTVDRDRDWIGELIVVDPATLEEQYVDTQVFGYRAPPVTSHDPNTLLYFVDDGERSGVWMAQLAP